MRSAKMAVERFQQSHGGVPHTKRAGRLSANLAALGFLAMMYVISSGPGLAIACENYGTYIVGGDNPKGRFPGLARVYYPLTLVCRRAGVARGLYTYVELFSEKKP